MGYALYFDKSAWKNNCVTVYPVCKDKQCDAPAGELCKLFASEVIDGVSIGQISYLTFFGPVQPGKSEPTSMTFTCPKYSSGISCAHFLQQEGWEWFARRAGISPFDYNRGDQGDGRPTAPFYCNSFDSNHKQEMKIAVNPHSNLEHYILAGFWLANPALKQYLVSKYHTEDLEFSMVEETSAELTGKFFEDNRRKVKKIAKLQGASDGSNRCPGVRNVEDYKAEIYSHGIINNKEINACGFMLSELPRMSGCYGKVYTNNVETRCGGNYKTKSKMRLICSKA
ncbi:MAG: hypothetical protein ABH829_02160 [archaeon]